MDILAYSSTVACLLLALLYLTGSLTRSTYILTRPPSETAVRYAVLGAERWRRHVFPS